ncbi:MAG: 50S ribosomal protein L4 [Candidatus Acidiferrales bacterium]
MPVVDVFNLSGKTVGQVELADEVFGAKVNRDLLHEAVRHFLNSQRAGTHKTKDKSEVSGAGRKLWRQKGTGRARVGSIRSPLWRHGGTVHGPTPRSYDYRFPRQMVAGALRSALSAKLAESKLTVVDAWTLDTHKSKAFRASLTGLHKDCRTMLLVSNGENLNLERASRNLANVMLVPSTKLEPYDLLRHDRLVLSREAAERLSNALRINKVAVEPGGTVQIVPAASEGPAAEAAPAKSKPKTKAAPAAAEKKAGRKKAAKEKPQAKPKAKKG